MSEGKEEVSFALGYCLDRLESTLDGLNDSLIAEIHCTFVSKEVSQNSGVSVRSSLKELRLCEECGVVVLHRR